ncbi:hypothetical protein BCR43DRAFT_69288 [Syncephalastrum racemosum]|uniref:Uncharacterized protein n=1 Tax=Syncephalastrum racemosum TaxID=13706 RepID=A0A1X2HWI6_SYNRA|nr:hypothetical protein BCR43DRAFT_69288 [Syncephalastrum racemosum]
MSNNDNIYFDQGVMKLFRFDPSSNRYETQVLCLPDPPALESLEHLFCEPTTAPRMMRVRSASKSRFAEVFEARHFRRLQKSSSSASTTKPTSTRLPRRCYSTPSLKKTKSTASTAPTMTTTSTAPSNTTHAPTRRSSSKRLSHALQQLVTGLMRRQKKRSYRNEWHTETWIAHMREEEEENDVDVDMSFSMSESSSLVEEPPLKKKRQHENWWAASPPLASAPMMLVA